MLDRPTVGKEQAGAYPQSRALSDAQHKHCNRAGPTSQSNFHPPGNYLRVGNG